MSGEHLELVTRHVVREWLRADAEKQRQIKRRKGPAWDAVQLEWRKRRFRETCADLGYRLTPSQLKLAELAIEGRLPKDIEPPYAGRVWRTKLMNETYVGEVIP